MIKNQICPICKSKNYDDKKGCTDCGFAGLCLSEKENEKKMNNYTNSKFSFLLILFFIMNNS